MTDVFSLSECYADGKCSDKQLTAIEQITGSKPSNLRTYYFTKGSPNEYDINANSATNLSATDPVDRKELNTATSFQVPTTNYQFKLNHAIVGDAYLQIFLNIDTLTIDNTGSVALRCYINNNTIEKTVTYNITPSSNQ